MSDTKLLRHYLENDPFQNTLSLQERAYFLSSLSITYAHADETLYTPKSSCDSFYYIAQGSVLIHLPEGKNVTLKPGMVFGEESILGLSQYSTKSTAQEPTTLLRFSGYQGQKINEENTIFRKALLTSFMQKFNSSLKPLKKEKELAAAPPFSASVTLLSTPTKWGLSLLVPLFSYIFMRTYEIDLNLHLLITLFSTILCLWSFSLMPAYGAAFLILTGSLILNFMSSAKLLSSLSGDSFMILVFILGLGRAFQTSSISYRLMLKILKFMPPTHFWTNSAIFSLSAFFTPFIPSSVMRQKMMQGIVQHFIAQLSLSPTSATAQKIALSTYAGTTLLGPIFLTGSVYNLFMLSILRHDQSHFQWWEWFAGALPTCCFLLVFFFLGLSLFFKEDERCGLFRDRIETQLKVIGPLESQDRSLIGLLGIYIIALSTSAFHGLSEGLISLLMTSLLMIFYFLPYPQKSLKNDETLTALILFISLTSLISIFNFETSNVDRQS